VTAAPKVQNIASKEVERRSKEEREILQRPADDESEEEDVDFISWEIYKELNYVGKEKELKMSHRTTRQAASQVLEVMESEEVEKFADAGQPEPEVPYTVEQCQLLAEVEAWSEDDAELEEDVDANISEQSCAPKREAEEAEIVMKALAEEDCLAKKLASSAACDEEEMDRERDELIADIWMRMNRKAEEEMMAALEMVQEKKEQYKAVPLMTDKQDLVGVSMSMQVEGVSGVKAEAETMVDRMHSTLKEEQGLKEEKVIRGKKEWHEPSPLVANKLLPPDREGSWAVGGVRG